MKRGKRDPGPIAKAENKNLSQNIVFSNRLADLLGMELLEL